MKEKAIWVLSKGPFYLFLFLLMIFLIVDVVFNLQIINKSQGMWYTNTGSIVTVGVMTVVGVGFLNSFVSKVYFYKDFLLIKTLFKTKKIWYMDITELRLSSSGTTPNHFFAFYDTSGNFLGSINAQYASNRTQKKKFILFLLKHQPSIKLNQKCEKIIKNNR